MPGDSPPVRRHRVLVVEDEMMVAIMLKDFLTDTGYEVVGPVGRLASALALAGSREIDAALLDVNVRGEAVYPVAQILAERRIPFALVTGYDTKSIAFAYQSSPVVTKPFRGAEIVAVLRELLGTLRQIPSA
jgi:DNA-binding response OmpR family regulator